jgi:hypothetical protein
MKKKKKKKTTTAPENLEEKAAKKRRISSTQELYEENVNLPFRVPKYSPNQRFDGTNTFKKRKAVNQYNKPTFEEDSNNTYAWLISNTRVQPSEGGGHFKCWILDTQAQGIQILPATGYARISFRGAYYMAHVFAWLYHHPGQRLQHDASHECGNKLCIRHIADETREYNNSRSGCLGYLIDLNDNNIMIKHCTHESPCKRVTLYNPANIVNLPKET